MLYFLVPLASFVWIWCALLDLSFFDRHKGTALMSRPISIRTRMKYMGIMPLLLLVLVLALELQQDVALAFNVVVVTNHHSNDRHHVTLVGGAHLVSRSRRRQNTASSVVAAGHTKTTTRSTTTTGLCAHVDRRRQLIATAATSTLGVLTAMPSMAHGGIDVRGLPVQGGGGATSSPNADLVNQLRQSQYNDGSAARRVQDLRTSAVTPPPTITSGSTSRTDDDASSSVPPVGVATWALRATEPVLGKLNFGATSRYQGRIVGPPSSSTRSIAVNFDFPSDWLQLDRANGCVQFVDQRNGDKLYLLRVTLPTGMSLSTVPKQFFATALFDPAGSLVRSGGLTVEDARVAKDITPADSSGRRLLLKFATLTGNGLRVERRGLVQAYRVPGDDNNDVYMMVTSSNAVKFEQGGLERDTVDNIINSFRLEFA
jgi:hypothetical protein